MFVPDGGVFDFSMRMTWLSVNLYIVINKSVNSNSPPKTIKFCA